MNTDRTSPPDAALALSVYRLVVDNGEGHNVGAALASLMGAILEGSQVDVVMPSERDPNMGPLWELLRTLLPSGGPVFDYMRELPTEAEPLYLLTMGYGSKDADTTITTLTAFVQANPDAADAIRTTWADLRMQEAGAVDHGGGGASPRWRLERTSFVGTRGAS